MGHGKVGPREAALREMREANYVRNLKAAPRAATVADLKVKMADAGASAGKRKAAKKAAKAAKKKRA
jgi:hypothetical protein